MNRSIEVHAAAATLRTANVGLQRVLAAAFAGRQPLVDPASGPYWPASHFGLDRVGAYAACSEGEQRAILALCSRDLIAEAWSVERLGMCFSAKMVLLARSEDERALHGRFAADEVAHFRAISPFLVGAEPPAPSPFLHFLGEIIETGTRESLICIVQLVLEGWGLHHYRALARGTVDAGLAVVLHEILHSEALHHAAGVALFDESALSASDEQRLVEILCRLYTLVQAGPQGVVAAIERVTGGATRAGRIRMFEELRCEETSTRDLGQLSALLRGAKGESLLASLGVRGRLRAYTATECADA